jgi:hypothetical protein
MGAQCRPLFGHQVAFPHVRQVVLQFFRRKTRQIGQHAADIQLHVDLVSLGAGNQRPEHCVALGRFIVPGKQPVLSSYGNPAQGAFGHVIVHAQAGIGRVRCALQAATIGAAFLCADGRICAR